MFDGDREGRTIAPSPTDATATVTFVVYLLSHNPPMAEVLRARRKDFSAEFLRGFDGVTDKPITQEELAATREEMIEQVIVQMPESHRRFVISFEHG